MAPERLLCGPTTVDENIRPGDETCSFGTQVQRKLTDLLHTPPTADRDFCKELPVKLRVLDQRRVQLRGKRARADSVYGDTFLSKFQGQRTR